ncbi:MAG TPA: cation diffusion facilitator family transporter [Rhizomicrobium sp.]|nr:cation diffusion facilitator family transporter [Rhizomicrobium sp.]
MDARAGKPDVTAQGAALMKRATYASLGISVGLVAIKAGAFFLTGSVAVLASLADSALDLFTSTLNLVAIRSALTPADAEHRFGHGKAEPLAGLAQGAFIAASATFIVIQAIGRLIAPQPMEHGDTALAVMVVSLIAAVAIVAYQRHVTAKTGSLAIGADKMHYTGDIVTVGGVILAIVLSTRFGWQLADPIIALLVAGALVWAAWSVFRPSYDQLMDRELADADRARIERIVYAHPQVRGLHELRTRAAGLHTFIQLHIVLAPDTSLVRAHAISDEVEASLCDAFPNAEVIIHQDPWNDADANAQRHH